MSIIEDVDDANTPFGADYVNVDVEESGGDCFSIADSFTTGLSFGAVWGGVKLLFKGLSRMKSFL